MFAFIDEDPAEVLRRLIRDVFYAAATCIGLYTAHRIANGVMCGSRLTALRKMGDAYAPEEREILIHRIKQDTLRR